MMLHLTTFVDTHTSVFFWLCAVFCCNLYIIAHTIWMLTSLFFNSCQSYFVIIMKSFKSSVNVRVTTHTHTRPYLSSLHVSKKHFHQIEHLLFDLLACLPAWLSFVGFEFHEHLIMRNVTFFLLHFILFYSIQFQTKH